MLHLNITCIAFLTLYARLAITISNILTTIILGPITSHTKTYYMMRHLQKKFVKYITESNHELNTNKKHE